MSGIYSLLSAAKTQERNLEVTANNLANANTSGFKADKPVFREFLKSAQATAPGHLEERFKHNEFLAYPNSENTSYAITEDVISDMLPGSYQKTDNPYDLAIKGEGFFAIATPEGIRYTKDGAFQRSESGFLVDAAGNFVLGTNGQISIAGQELTINEEGVVQVDGNFIDQLHIVTFDQNSKLTKVGKSYYLPDSSQPAIPITNAFSVQQGMIEKSNVVLVKEMLNLITAERSFQAAQRGIRTMDDIDAQSLRLAR